MIADDRREAVQRQIRQAVVRPRRSGLPAPPGRRRRPWFGSGTPTGQAPRHMAPRPTAAAATAAPGHRAAAPDDREAARRARARASRTST
jgi:hypothetical protein